MPNKVTWKKGMRLSAEIFNAMDAARDEALALVAGMASAGRFGLFPSAKPFELNVNVTGNMLEVSSLRCSGMTSGGRIVDINYDSGFNNTFDTRVAIPQGRDDEAFLLTVKVHGGQWREVDEVYSEPLYTFGLIAEDSRVDADSLPVGRLVNQYGWRLDETGFVPPCLCVGAHPRMVEQADRASRLAKSIINKCLTADNCVARTLVGHVWTAASQVYHTIDKQRDTLSPQQLYCEVQRLVGSFLTGCTLEEHVSLENREPYVAYTQKSRDTRHVFRDIETGISLCAEIEMKMDAVCAMTEVKPVHTEPAPPKPAPQPAPAPAPSGRNRWDGIEI